MGNWVPKNWTEVLARASGRRKRAAKQRLERAERRRKLVELLGTLNGKAPSQRILAKLMGIPVRTLRLDMDDLRAAGALAALTQAVQDTANDPAQPLPPAALPPTPPADAETSS